MGCITCPARLWKDSNIKKEMDFDTFLKLSKYFKHTDLVHLQGWGEPLLHDRIFDMIKIVKKTSKVGFTTNGLLLKREVNKKIVELEVDFVAVSFAGTTKEGHGSLKTSNLSRITENVKDLVKARGGLEKPHIIFTFLMSKTNVRELPDLVDLAADLGVNEVVVRNLDYVFDEATDKLRAFSCFHEKDYLKLIDSISEARKRAIKRNIKFRPYPLVMEEIVMCDANPLKGLVISAEGDLYPCIYLNLPFKKIPRIFCGQRIEIEKPYFGSIDDFWNSWNSKDYVEFRKAYERRVEAYKEVLHEALFSPSSVDHTMSKIRKVFTEHPIPEICKTCYKAYGV